MIFGLAPLDIAVIILYLLGISYIGIRSSRGVKSTGDFFMGGRRFGKLPMVAKAFGVGTRVDHVVAITGASYQLGLSGVWYQWLYMFGTPFYWMIAPIYRRLRYVTTGDFFEERYGSSAGTAYTIGALLFLAVEIGMMLRGTATTVEALTQGAMNADAMILVATIAFIGYSSMGGLVAAVSTKLLQSFMILTLSLLMVPFAFSRIGGFAELHARLPASMFDLFSSWEVTPFVITMMTINGLVGVIAMPHHMAICGAGKSEANCRTGLTYGNVVKRFATLAWAFTGVMGAALFPGMVTGGREQALGTLILHLLPVGLVGLMIAAMLASLMAVCDSYMVDGAALYTRNVYRKISGQVNDDRKSLRIGRFSSIVVALCGVGCAFLLSDVLTGLTIIWKITAFFGIPFWLAVIWRRGNRFGLWASLIVTTAVALGTQAAGWTLAEQIAAYLPAGVVAFVLVSLLTRPEPEEKLKNFYFLLHTPVGEEHRLRAAGVPAILEGQSSLPPAAKEGIPLEEQGHSLVVVDILNLVKLFSYRRYRIDLIGFLAATVLILGIVGIGLVLAAIGA